MGFNSVFKGLTKYVDGQTVAETFNGTEYCNEYTRMQLWWACKQRTLTDRPNVVELLQEIRIHMLFAELLECRMRLSDSVIV